MDTPTAGGPFKSLDEIRPTLLALFKDEVAATYLPWARANMDAAQAQAERVSLKLDGKVYEQITQHYAARAFKAVTTAVQSAKEAPGLSDFLTESGAATAFAD